MPVSTSYRDFRETGPGWKTLGRNIGALGLHGFTPGRCFIKTLNVQAGRRLEHLGKLIVLDIESTPDNSNLHDQGKLKKVWVIEGKII